MKGLLTVVLLRRATRFASRLAVVGQGMTEHRPVAMRDIGYGWRRKPYWPWHVVMHHWLGRRNNWRSRLFCTYCVDDRMRDFYAESRP